MVHQGADGRDDGYAIYRTHEGNDGSRLVLGLDVVEVVAVDDAADLALWRALLDHDLVETVTASLPVDHLLFDVLSDARSVQVHADSDRHWVRILDMAAMLGGRTYGTEDQLVLDVIDDFRPDGADVGGLHVLTTSATGARCLRSEADPSTADLTIDVADLGALSLGGGSCRHLVRAGRVVERTEGAAARADAAFATYPQPFCPTKF